MTTNMVFRLTMFLGQTRKDGNETLPGPPRSTRRSDSFSAERHDSTVLDLLHRFFLLFLLLFVRVHGDFDFASFQLSFPLERRRRRSNEVDVLLDLFDVGHLAHFFALLEAIDDVLVLALDLDLVDALHGVERLGPQLALVLDGDVAPLLHLEGRVDGEVLAGGLPECFRPARLPRIPFPLEQFVTFAPAELEHFAVVADELNPVARVDGRRTKVTLFHPHLARLLF